MTKEEAIKKIFVFEQKAVKEFQVSKDAVAFAVSVEKVKRNLEGFGISMDDYAAYVATQNQAPAPSGFFTGRAKPPHRKDLDSIIEDQINKSAFAASFAAQAPLANKTDKK